MLVNHPIPRLIQEVTQDKEKNNLPHRIMIRRHERGRRNERKNGRGMYDVYKVTPSYRGPETGY